MKNKITDKEKFFNLIEFINNCPKLSESFKSLINGKAKHLDFNLAQNSEIEESLSDNMLEKVVGGSGGNTTKLCNMVMLLLEEMERNRLPDSELTVVKTQYRDCYPR